ncbi:MAG: hypothetical protein RL326_2011 [Pseudomonadota bacterium]
MNTHDGSKGSKEQEYLSKRVLVNGQFVTLYSLNGQTWLSSPEEIPELMARLDNTRIMLSNPEKPEGEAQQAKPQSAEPPAAKTASNKYRMKGPKPRPILKQGGVVIKGTPIEPISASNTVVSFSHDQEMAEEAGSSPKRTQVEVSKTKGSGKLKTAAAKHIAPVLSTVGKAKKSGLPEKSALKATKAKSAAVTKSKEVTIAAKKPALKATPSPRPSGSKKPGAAKSGRKAAPVQKIAKSAAKSVTKAKAKKGKPAPSKKKSAR